MIGDHEMEDEEEETIITIEKGDTEVRSKHYQNGHGRTGCLLSCRKTIAELGISISRDTSEAETDCISYR